jgi:hypothetical protein
VKPVAFLLPLLLVSVAFPQAGRSRSGAMCRYDYPSDDFSIAVPASWSEVDGAVLDQFSAELRQALPNAPDTTVDYGFRSPQGARSGFPLVAVVVSGGQPTDAMLDHADRVYRSVDELTQRWLASGGPLQKSQTSGVFYDNVRHVLWAVSQNTFAGAGDFRNLSAVYVTKFGSVQVHCCSKASEYEKYRLVCKQIVGSVTIDPKVATPAKPAK